VSNYTKSTNFATKDALSSGDPLKIVKGTEIDTEFNNIATAVATKADLASPTFTGTPTLPTGTIATTQSFGNSTTAIATTAFVQAAMAALFPVGAIYTAVVSTNPGTLLGFGTWTAFGAGRTLVGLDAGNALFDTAEETGGAADATLPTHTHTASTAASGPHTHTINEGSLNQSSGGQLTSGDDYTNIVYATQTTSSGGDHTHTITVDSAGSSGTNANYQPYITVYMWKRTA